MINTTDTFDDLDDGPLADPETTAVQSIPPERIQAVTHTLSQFFEPGEHFEIRCLKPFAKGQLVVSGGFTDPKEASIWALSAEIDAGFNVYFGLNPRTNKEPSHELQWGKAYSRRHVAYLRWVFIDFDPVRSGGGATANEKKHAYELMGKILRLLCNKYGWPRPIICDSGNGYHLFFRTNLTCEQRRLITIALKALADHFSTSHVKIDAGVDDAAQITRCYGTLNRKGSNTTERPWRHSQAFGEGVSPDLVTEKQLELLPILYPPTSLASKTPAPKQERTKRSTPYTGGRYDVPAILADCDLDYDHKLFETDEGEADPYELAECPWAEEHSTGAGGACVIQFPSGAVAFL